MRLPTKPLSSCGCHVAGGRHRRQTGLRRGRLRRHGPGRVPRPARRLPLARRRPCRRGHQARPARGPSWEGRQVARGGGGPWDGHT